MQLRKWFSLDSIYILMKKMGPYHYSACPKLKRALHKKPPLEICFLSTIWVPIEVKMKMSLEKVTQVISQSGVRAGLSKLHIDWINCDKVWFYFYYMNCNSIYITECLKIKIFLRAVRYFATLPVYFYDGQCTSIGLINQYYFCQKGGKAYGLMVSIWVEIRWTHTCTLQLISLIWLARLKY